MRAPLLLLPLLALLTPTLPGQQPTVRTLLSNGPTSNRYDMVILGDGYVAAEQARFDQDCQTFLNALFQKEPYRTFGGFFNVHTVFRPSLMSGANHPDANPPIVRNPVYGASYNTGGTARCLYITNTPLALADAALAPANEGRVLVMVNDSRYGGCAGTFAVSYNGSSMAEVQIHEIGHSIGQLADEYDYPNSTYTGSEPSQVNATTNSSGQKWSHWWGFNGVAAFEGCRYYLYGLWRPRSNCLMRSLGQPMCPVCIEQTSRVIHGVVSSIDQPSPSQANLALNAGAVQTFAFTNLVPPGNNPAITWRLDGQPLPGVTGTSHVLDTGTLALGPHTLSVTVRDQTALVRVDPANTLVDTWTWNITLTDPSACDLRITTLSPTGWLAAPGTAIDVGTTVINDGPAVAGAFTVEHFLSVDQTLDPTDLSLGGYTVPGLGVGQADTRTRTQVLLPHSLSGSFLYLIAVVDRANAVREVNEANNQRAGIVIGQAPGCTPALEYRDPLRYPRDEADVAIATGGTALPTVVARCATPGTAYLIVWGCAGTSPGTTLAPGITVPINQDLCTLLGLQALNGAIFQQFWGTLDAQGIGRATFAWPAGLNMLPMQSHFAAVLLDATPSFTGVTNPVRLGLQ